MEFPDAEDFHCEKDDFKIVYVAPMKALASEIVQKMQSRLAWLGIQVRELTGNDVPRTWATCMLMVPKVTCT
jgi:antiviral helicase SLH1